MKIFLLRLLFLFFLSLSASTSTFASHVVGGDFRITMTNNIASGAYYNFQLRLFRDDVNGLATIPTSAPVGIYEIGTNALVANVTLYQANLSLVNLGDPCYTPDPSIVRIQEGILQNNLPILLPNNSNGYYIQYEIFARNAIVTNIFDPGNTGMGIFAMFPDPSLGQNSSPDFGIYPADAYFCINENKVFNFPVNDPDGDSLVYSFVTPLKSITDLSNFIPGGSTEPGSGSYPYYPECTWATSYSLNNIIGGSPSMTINPNNGIISASPSIQNFFVYTVRVEEFRNGTKIGEVRRDVQYASLGCTKTNPPFISINNDVDSSGISSDTLSILINVKDSLCFDLEFGVKDPLGGLLIDTSKMYLQLTSDNFDLASSFVQPNADTVSNVSINTYLSYYNWENVSGDTVFFNLDTNNTVVDSGYIEFTGFGYFRYCWQAPCESFDSTFNILVDAYSKDCSGINRSQKNIIITVGGPTQGDTLLYNSLINSELFQETCFDVFAFDDSNFIDTLFLEAMSIDFLNILYADSVFDPFSRDSIASKETVFLDSFFDFEAMYQPPLYNNVTGQFYYENFNNTPTFLMNGFSHINNISSAVQSVGMRFCFTPDCSFIKIRDSIQDSRNYQLTFKTYSTICFSDTLFGNTKITIDLHNGEQKDIPNIFTPNGDLLNDVFKLNDTLSDPCFDFMNISIYNRWGQLVFEDNDPNFEWDGTSLNGKECKSGSYLIIINGDFGSKYDSYGRREGIAVKDENWIQLFRK